MTWQTTIRNFGKSVMAFAEYLGGLALLSKQTAFALLSGGSQSKDILRQFKEIGVRTLSLTNLIGLFTGMVLSLQLIVGLKRFGLSMYSGQVVGVAITRELGPVLTALMVSARVGAGIASELGSMTVSEQVLAIRAMGANPILKLVLPRVLVATVATPILTIVAIFVGIFGGMLISVAELGISPQYYLDQIRGTVEIYDLSSGVAKTVFFGFTIGIIACYEGLRTTGGTQGVGQATKQAVVFSAIAIFVLDFFLTKLFLLF